jgi:hypothetical protein
MAHESIDKWMDINASQLNMIGVSASYFLNECQWVLWSVPPQIKCRTVMIPNAT